jgi:predicted metal-dependent hydrolase
MTVIASASRMPEVLNLEARNVKFELSEQLSKDWLDNDPFFNVLSMRFPPGKRLFIDSVRQYQDEVKDPKLKEEMIRFFDQEGMHSRKHRKYNQMLCDLKYRRNRRAIVKK